MHASVAVLLRFTCKLIHEGLPHYASMSLTVLLMNKYAGYQQIPVHGERKFVFLKRCEVRNNAKSQSTDWWPGQVVTVLQLRQTPVRPQSRLKNGWTDIICPNFQAEKTHLWFVLTNFQRRCAISDSPTCICSPGLALWCSMVQTKCIAWLITQTT